MSSDSTLLNSPPGVSNEDLSRVIGLIYDCAIDPELWPVALEGVCRLTSSQSGGITVLDSTTNELRFASQWGLEPDKLQLLNEKYGALSPIWSHLHRLEIDEPVGTRNLVGEDEYLASRFHQEWAGPAGYQDLIGSLLVKSGRGYGTIAVTIGSAREPVQARDLAILRQLVPHVRRAIVISDMLDMRSLEAASVKSTLDLLLAAVVLTDGVGTVIHANAAARAMLEDGDPIQISFDKLTVRNDDAANALRKAISRAANAESEMGGSGIGVPVPFADGRPAIAHVLPLATPPLRSQLAPSVKAAVFISTTDAHLPPVEALTGLYELTPAEQKVLASVLDGRNQAETAEHLKLAESTVKTHLGRIFSKTNTTNQSELTKLAERLAAPAAIGAM